MVYDLGFRVYDLGLRELCVVYGLRIGVYGLGFRELCLVYDLGFRARGSPTATAGPRAVCGGWFRFRGLGLEG